MWGVGIATIFSSFHKTFTVPLLCQPLLWLWAWKQGWMRPSPCPQGAHGSFHARVPAMWWPSWVRGLGGDKDQHGLSGISSLLPVWRNCDLNGLACLLETSFCLCLFSKLQISLATPRWWLLCCLCAFVLLPLYALPYLSVQKGACSQIPGLAVGGPVASPGILCTRVSSYKALAAGSPSSLVSAPLNSYSVSYCSLVSFFKWQNCTSHLVEGSFLISVLLNFHVRLAHNTKVGGAAWGTWGPEWHLQTEPDQQWPSHLFLQPHWSLRSGRCKEPDLLFPFRPQGASKPQDTHWWRFGLFTLLSAHSQHSHSLAPSSRGRSVLPTIFGASGVVPASFHYRLGSSQSNPGQQGVLGDEDTQQPECVFFFFLIF